MSLLRARPAYDRRGLLEQASRSEARGKAKKAVAAYRTILEHEPEDHVIRGKLAPLLASSGEEDAAWLQFQTAARAYFADGFPDKAISVYKRAAACFPWRYTIWEKVVDVQLECGRTGEALATLLKAIPGYKGRKGRWGRVALLRRAHEIAPEDSQISFDYGLSLLRAGHRDEGVHQLDRLVGRLEGAELQRVRGYLLRARLEPRRLWHWLRAVTLGR